MLLNRELRLRRARRTLIGSALGFFGDRPAKKGILRQPKTALQIMKWAEKRGLYS